MSTPRGVQHAPKPAGPAVVYVRDLRKLVRVMDWLDMCFLLYMVGAGIVAGLVYEILMDQFR